ncbi:ATP-binding protein [bacterium]|nr:ATP-binding protein [bacterium]
MSFDLTISNPAELLTEIARRYESTTRVIMEYIDNSLDDAEELFRNYGNVYPRPIGIDVTIDRGRRTVSILDNCRGMDIETLCRVVRNVGESRKKGMSWLNGQFGFGVHAFRAAAKRIEFRTCSGPDSHYILSFNRSEFKGLTPPRSIQASFPTENATGTEITLSEFEEEWFDELDAEILQEELEKHFELLLARANLSIRIHEGLKTFVCAPFDYGKFTGKEFVRDVPVGALGHKIKIFLKVTDAPVTTRRSTFFARGRRINEIMAIKSFISRSKFRTALWGHNHLVGYIEVTDWIDPVITRDEFQKGRKRVQLYEAILAFEQDLKDTIDEVNKQNEIQNMGTLEKVISSVLSRIAREDALKFRHEAVLSGDLNLKDGGGSMFTDDVGGPTGEDGGKKGNGGTGEGEGTGPKGSGQGTGPGSGEGGPADEESQSPSPYAGATRRKSGFDIKFVSFPPDVDGRLIRSNFVEGTIQINVSHPDFEQRLERSRQGGLKVGLRLVAYLASVISIHYKDQFYDKYKNQPDVRTQLLDEQVAFQCRLESALVPFMGELERILSEG